jgi:hypothetical protein
MPSTFRCYLQQLRRSLAFVRQNRHGRRLNTPAPRSRVRLEVLEDRLAPAFNVSITSAAMSSGGAFALNGTTEVFTPTMSGAIASTSDIQNFLNAGKNVSITTGTMGNEAGDININAAITQTAGGATTLTLTPAEDVIDNGFAIDTTATSGTVTLSAGRDITLNSGSGIKTTAGAIALSANEAATPVSGNFIGINAAGAVITSVTGAIGLQGRGGDTGDNNIGIALHGGTTVSMTTATAGAAGITLNGTGGPGGSQNNGVALLDTGSAITSVARDIQVIGIAGAGSGTVNNGVFLAQAATSPAPTITSASGNILVQGTGGNGTGTFGQGVSMENGSSIATTGSGSVTVQGSGGTGAGSGGSNYGVELDSGSTISAAAGSSGTIAITGTAGTGAFANGVILFSGAGITSKGTGALNLTATSSTNAALFIDATASNLIGGTTYAGIISLNVTSATLDGGTVATTGVAKLNATMGAFDASGGGVLNVGQLLLTGVGPFNLPTTTNKVSTLAGAVNGNVTFHDSAALTVGTVAGTIGLNAGAGTVNLTGNTNLSVTQTLKTSGAVTLTGGAAGNGASINLTAAVRAARCP